MYLYRQRPEYSKCKYGGRQDYFRGGNKKRRLNFRKPSKTKIKNPYKDRIMIKYISAIALGIILLVAGATFISAQDSDATDMSKQDELSLITETPEEGFAVAVQLARKGVTTTQPNKDVLFMLRDVYSKDPDALIAASHVVAVHYQTVAAANNYWRD